MLPHEKQIAEYEKLLAQAKEQSKDHALWSQEEIVQWEQKLEDLKKKCYSQLSSWERVAICRHSSRPRSLDYIQHLCKDFTELHGDRLYGDDPSIIAGIGRIEETKFMILAQEKGCDTESRLRRNFGMPHPEGYRKALRCMQLAAKFQIPVLSLLDTPGAYPGLAAEERGQGWAIAKNLWEMARLPVPIIVVLIGEGCSGGALGMGVGDVVGMLQHAYYSVISPEGCASILWKDSTKNAEAAAALKLHAEDLFAMEIIDAIIEEPLGGAHHDPAFIYQKVKEYILEQESLLRALPLKLLLEKRYYKFRKIGKFALQVVEKPSLEKLPQEHTTSV